MRDVIQVERADGTGDGPGSLAELARVADELLPPLVARLGVSDLGEIEVRRGTWRVRIRRGPATAEVPAAPVHGAAHAAPVHGVAQPHGGAHAAPGQGPAAGAAGSIAHGSPTSAPPDPMALSTAVGYFGVRSGLAVGHRVERGDVIGWVDVLGVRKDIMAPADGVVGRFVTDPGDPVEYGQELVAFIAASSPGTPVDGPAADGPAAAPAANGQAGPA